MYQDEVTTIVIDQTFQLPQPIDTLVSVDVEPSQLIETKEGFGGTLDLMIYYEPCEEREHKTDAIQDTLLITDIRESETNEVCAFFSFPIELYGMSELPHLVVSELDYVLPTRSTFTLKANVQVFQPNTRIEELNEDTEGDNTIMNYNQTDETEVITDELTMNRANEKVLEEDVLVYTPKKQLDKPNDMSLSSNPEQSPQQDGAIVQKTQAEVVKDKMNTEHEINREADIINNPNSNQFNDQDEVPSTKNEAATRIEVPEVEETGEEKEVTTKDVIEKDTRVIYQHYGLKRLDNPHVKLPCVIVKEDVSLSDWCHAHGLEVTRLKRVNVHLEETIKAGQVLILPDDVVYT